MYKKTLEHYKFDDMIDFIYWLYEYDEDVYKALEDRKGISFENEPIVELDDLDLNFVCEKLDRTWTWFEDDFGCLYFVKLL